MYRKRIVIFIDDVNVFLDIDMWRDIFVCLRFFGCFFCFMFWIYGWFIYFFFIMWFCDYIIIFFFIIDGNVFFIDGNVYVIRFCWNIVVNCIMVRVICWNYFWEIWFNRELEIWVVLDIICWNCFLE